MQRQQQSQPTAITDTPQIVQRPDECGVCLFVYDEVDRRPRCLPCGHIYCSLCVSTLLEDGHLICPNCRADHCAPEVSQFPICYPLETMMKVMRTQQVEVASQATGEAPQSSQKGSQVTETKGSQVTETKTRRMATTGLSRKLRSMIHEQKVSIETLETAIQDELEQINQYRAQLIVSRTEHTNLLKELDKLVQQHQANIDLLQEEDGRMESFMEEGETIKMELRAAQSQLDQINTAQEAFTTIDTADHTIVGGEEWLQHSREEIPNGAVLGTSLKMLDATKAALEVITEETEATPDKATSGHLNSTVMEAVESFKGGPVELVDLHTEKLRKNVEAGKVFATQRHADGTCYSSKIMYQNSKVYLHALKKELPPRSTFALEVSKALENLNYTSISVFLDLSWQGTSSQRFHIKLSADTPLTRQFVSLCLGHTGLTYCNTRLFSVENYNNLRIVWGGNITGQTAADKKILPPIIGNVCGSMIYPSQGKVIAKTDVSNDASRTFFGIVIVHGNIPMHGIFAAAAAPPGYKSQYYQIGSVGADLQGVLQTAANNITQVRVVDCGVVY